MAATLTQSAAASFPDRPGNGNGTGLRVTLADNIDGAYLEHTLSSAPAPFHTRVMIRPANLSGGYVTFLRGLDTSSNDTFRITFDADLNQIQFNVGTNSLTASPTTVFDWHAIEITIDSNAGSISLDINGITVASQSNITVNPTTTLRLGTIGKHTDTTGTLDLDEWIIADQIIGTVGITPTSPYADDPAAWLVVYNTQISDSITWANTYRQQRNIPYANLCGLNLSTAETIDATDFTTLTQQIQTYLQRNQLENTIIGILLGYGIPGYADLTGIGPIESIPALLHTTSITAGASPNPIDASTNLVRPTIGQLNGHRLTARIDAPTLADATTFLDRATTLDSTDFGNAADTTLWLDPYTAPSGLTTPHINAMVTWAQNITAQQLRIPIQTTISTQIDPNPNFSQINNDGFYWGWSNASPPTNFFTSPSGQRIFAIDLHTLDTTAPTLRNWTNARWVGAAFTAGYAAAAGTSRNYSLSSLPQASIFFEALRNDLTLAESFFLACPILRDGLFLVGDPLMTIRLPRAGWDVFGPINTLETMNFSAPTTVLRLDQTTWVANTTPEYNTQYVIVRHRDTQGRSDAGINVLRFATANQAAVSPPMSPLWPDRENWSPIYINQNLIATIIWDRPIGLTQIATAALWMQIDNQSASLVKSLAVDPLSRSITTTLTAPTASTRYQFRVTSDDGITLETSWSVFITTASPDAGHNPLIVYSSSS